jgi:hypothetical protein
MQLVEHTVYTFVTQYMCVFVLSWFLLKNISAEKVKATRSTVLTIFNRDWLPLLVLHLYKQIFFSYMALYGEIMLFLRYRLKFFTCFSKNAAKFLWLWYMNWNKRVRSECRKSHFQGPRFQNFGPPYKCKVLCMHQSAQELDPPLMAMAI